MPYYDQYSGMEVETPEEEAARKRREAEDAAKKAGETPVATKEVVTYEDGSQTHTTTQEIPNPAQGVAKPTVFDNLGNAIAAMPTNFVNNLNRGIENLKAAPENFARNVQAIPGQVQQRVQQAVAPVAPDQAAYTRQQESGGNYNIGYHFPADAQGRRKSTAAGPYGFTAASVQDIARQDPTLNKPIEQWTKEDHDRGYAIKTQQNGQRLGQLGIEATPGALQVAHLLGADGAARFIKTGEVSPQAADANGGVERLKQIAQGRMAGAQAPASGAAQAQQQPAMGPVSPEQAQQQNQAPATTPAPNSYDEFGTPVYSQAQANLDTQINRYQSIQNKPDELLKFAFDDNAPDFLKQRAKDQIVEQYSQQKKEAEATKAMASLTPNDVARAMTRKSEGNSVGDWIQYLLFRHVGLTDLANQKGEQLGIGHKWTQSTITDDAGNDVAIELQTTASGKVLGGNRMDGTPLTARELNLAGGSMGNKDYDIVGGTFVSDTLKDKNGNALVGTVYRSKTNPNKQFVQTDEGRKPLAGFRPQSTSGSLEQQGTSQLQKLRNDLQFKGPEAAAKALGEFDAMNGTRYLDQYKQNAPQFFQSIGMAPPGQQATGTATGGGAPAQAATTTATTTPVPVTTASPADITSGRKVTEAERVQFVDKVLPEINKKGDDGRYVADTRRTQVAMLTGPNSAIMGIYRGSGTEYDKARSVLRDAIAGAYSGKEGGERFSEALRGISIPAEQMSALKEFAQMNTGINAKTLAENAGEGPKSDADIKLNQAANMSNIGDLPAFAALTGLTRSQFAGDVNKRKQDFVLANRDRYQTQSQVEQAWSKEKDTLNRQYEGIYRARLNFIDAKMVEKFGQDWRKRPDSETQGFYRDASIHSFNVLPTPNYNVQSGTWEYPTQQSKLAAMKAITGK